MDNDFAIRLQDVTLEIPAERRLPRGIRQATNRAHPTTSQVGGRLSFGRGSSATVTILEGVNIRISRGQRVGVIGPNGAGKSTLLRVMAGIYYPTHGVAETRGTVSTLFPELLGVRPEATGLENIVLTGILLGLTRKDISRRIPEIVEFTELGDYIYMPLRTYSAGMRTRLVLSIATCISPDILLVDEVIGVGDRRFRLKAKERLNRMMTSANTLVVVSQSPEIIREFCGEAIWLERGQVRALGGVDEVLREYTTQAASPTVASNPGLVSDSLALLAARDTLAGSAALNWSEDAPIETWDGVTVSGSPKRVTRLVLRERFLSGKIPAEVGSLAGLTTLDLRGNRLSGEIPAELGKLSNLEVLHLHGNKLERSIPSEFGQLTKLGQMSLHNNLLSGEIPSELGRLSRLQVLHLHNNELRGEIPSELGQMTDLKILNLRNNRLSGSIPPELGQLTNLVGLYLHSNRLGGTIPGELGNLGILEDLWLSNNMLSGELPSQLCQLSGLTQLSLYSNRLSGEIPSELGRLGANMHRLRLANNRFAGRVPAGLAAVPDSDLDHLGLATCSDT